MQLFYAPDITPPLYTLSEEESKHCVRVLRLGRGDTLHITDGRGNLFCCQITDDNPKRCTVRVTTTQAQWEPLPYRLVMAVAPTKNADRFEWFLEKATEVGVSAIVPLETEHSERRVFKPERAGKVITAAMKQSLKACAFFVFIVSKLQFIFCSFYVQKMLRIPHKNFACYHCDTHKKCCQKIKNQFCFCKKCR